LMIIMILNKSDRDNLLNNEMLNKFIHLMFS
jgi:hypothetical protein